MTSAAVGDAVRALWEVGARYGRPPEPTPEVDPWEDDDPYPDGAAAVVVEFTGRPPIVVRLEVDGQDTVTLEDVLHFDVPRRDTVAVVDAVLGGRACLASPRGNPLVQWSAALLGSAWASSVRIPVDGGREYTCPLPSLAWSPWVGSLPVDAPDAR